MAARRASSKLLPSFLLSPKVIPASPAYFSTQIVGESPVLVRDFIHAALYDPNHGYFSQRSGSVGVLDRSIKFNELQGRKAYMKHLDKIYKQGDISWFTPVELFKPWYAHGIAEAILRTANLSVPLKIYEIGGGSGTCAKGVMDYIKLNAPTRVYDNMAYISVEISSSLAKKQLETVGEVGSHSKKFKVECRDAADSSGWGVEQQPCWVIMLEVLDNLPHDLIYSENQISNWMEVWVEKQHGKSELCELYKPLEDPLITSCMEVMGLPKDGITRGTLGVLSAKSLWAKLLPKPRRSWLPTGCLKLLKVLHGALPMMSLITADFSFLPDVRIPGERAPLVACKKDGSNSDHNNYLDAKSDADIFFPTDFGLLERMDHYCSGWLKPHESKSSKGKKRRTIMLDTSSFMEEFGLPSKTRTKDGYNPMLDDFKNTKFYLSVPTHNTK
ncbi:protein arginine methyltransferase NDUFAF7 homolog, mitochondrial isoform X1 [Primulina huaijiensis]|uniref:protein arginine methyltransferase NDUFAF7 homolog, mitochondrial isoform X1 n=2 Tax=Primulina huaijiensis TaxID=1492673 RepID=UPI003CC75A87